MSSARQITTGLMQEINATDIRMIGRSMTLAQLADHFRQRELGPSNSRISYSTKRAYQGYLNEWIVPRWGDYLLPNIKAVEVELWLKHLGRAAGTAGAERTNHGVVGCGNRTEQSELFALKWKDVDFKNKQLWVTRSIVQQVVGKCKTEASQKPVPLHDHLISALRSWHRRILYRTLESWVFASPQSRGKNAYWGQHLLRHHIRPVARKLGITKRIGCGKQTNAHIMSFFNTEDIC